MNVTTTSLHSYADAARRLHLGVQAVRRMVAAGQLVAVKPAGCARPRILGASMLALAAVKVEQHDEGAVMRDGPNAFEDVFARMQV